MSDITPEQIQASVYFVLTSNRLPVTEEERKRLVTSYPAMQEMIASLRIPEVRYGEPATIYPASIDR
jgi:hypothetical protein